MNTRHITPPLVCWGEKMHSGSGIGFALPAFQKWGIFHTKVTNANRVTLVNRVDAKETCNLCWHVCHLHDLLLNGPTVMLETDLLKLCANCDSSLMHLVNIPCVCCKRGTKSWKYLVTLSDYLVIDTLKIAMHQMKTCIQCNSMKRGDNRDEPIDTHHSTPQLTSTLQSFVVKLSSLCHSWLCLVYFLVCSSPNIRGTVLNHVGIAANPCHCSLHVLYMMHED